MSRPRFSTLHGPPGRKGLDARAGRRYNGAHLGAAPALTTMSNRMEPLSIASVEDIVEELDHRTDALVVAFILKDQGDGTEYVRAVRGEGFARIGLAKALFDDAVGSQREYDET